MKKMNQRKLIFLILLLFSIAIVINSSYAAEKTITSAGNFKSDINTAASEDTIKLDTSTSGGQFILDKNNVNVTINRTLTIQSANPSQKAIINLNKNGRGFEVTSLGKLTLINITIINGLSVDGGAIINSEGSLTLTGCTFSANSAADESEANHGGAIHNVGGVLVLNSCTFKDNQATSTGGAIFNSINASLTANNCIFTNNTAISGGAIRNFESSANLTNCSFTDNRADKDGGAIYNVDLAVLPTKTSVSLYNCNFTGNQAPDGGAFYSGEEDSSIIATNCIFIMNTASNGATAYNIGFGVLSFKSCNFTEKTESSIELSVLFNGVCSVDTDCNYYVLIDTILSISTAVSNDKISINLTAIDETYKVSAGREIYLYIDGKLVDTKTTNVYGVANFIYTTSKSGLHKIDVKVDGYTYPSSSSYKYLYSSSSITDTINVILPPVSYQTVLTVTNVLSANKITITANVCNKNTGQAIVNQTVYFSVNGKVVGNGKTNSKGIATFVYNSTKSGTHTINAELKGFNTTIFGRIYIHSESSDSKKAILSPAKIKLDKTIPTKVSVKKGKKLYTKVYKYKNLGHITGSKTFTIKISKKYNLSGKITKSGSLSYKYNKKTKTITLNVKKLAYSKTAQLKFKIIQV